MRILVIVFILVATSCGQRDSLSFMDDCQEAGLWKLKDLDNARLKFRIKLPATWQTNEDFVKGDTISLTAMDTVEFLKTGDLKIFSVMQYETTIGIDNNFDVIKESVKPFYETGRITINKNDGRYLLKEEMLGQDTVTTANILFQKSDYAINVIVRVTKSKDDKLRMCDYKQILNTLNLE